jgi:hypothetical protein
MNQALYAHMNNKRKMKKKNKNKNKLKVLKILFLSNKFFSSFISSFLHLLW